jgi:hypothetical protein
MQNNHVFAYLFGWSPFMIFLRIIAFMVAIFSKFYAIVLRSQNIILRDKNNCNYECQHAWRFSFEYTFQLCIVQKFNQKTYNQAHSVARNLSYNISFFKRTFLARNWHLEIIE